MKQGKIEAFTYRKTDMSNKPRKISVRPGIKNKIIRFSDIAIIWRKPEVAVVAEK